MKLKKGFSWTFSQIQCPKLCVKYFLYFQSFFSAEICNSEQFCHIFISSVISDTIFSNFWYSFKYLADFGSKKHLVISL